MYIKSLAIWLIKKNTLFDSLIFMEAMVCCIGVIQKNSESQGSRLTGSGLKALILG
jgi:hypothetical protein